MTVRRKTRRALAVLLPAGVLGISSALASTHTETPSAQSVASPAPVFNVADRLREIRTGVSEISALTEVAPDPSKPNLLIAEWVNFGGLGWRNGGWGNGWHNGGWGNGGWRNGGWGNGGWHNGGWGWHNGGWHNWHNFWHNW